MMPGICFKIQWGKGEDEWEIIDEIGHELITGKVGHGCTRVHHTIYFVYV